jgi:hypothetical protein
MKKTTKNINTVPHAAYKRCFHFIGGLLNGAAGLLKTFSQRKIVKEDGKLLNIHNSGQPQILHTLSAYSESTDLN